MPDATSQNGNGNGNGNGSGESGNQGTGTGPDANAGNNGAGSGGSSSNPTDNNFDPSKLSGPQLAKVLENQELWKLPRLQELLQSNKELQDLRKKQQDDVDKKLADDKKWEELAAKRDNELIEERKKTQQLTVNQQLTTKLAPLGVVDVDAALKLVDRDTIKVADDGTISGIDEAIESLKKDKAYLFTKGNGQSVGTPTNSENDNKDGAGVMKFKRSQLQNPSFYQEHRADILKAAAAGQIEDDITPHRQ